jgi:hypothetical protein
MVLNTWIEEEGYFEFRPTKQQVKRKGEQGTQRFSLLVPEGTGKDSINKYINSRLEKSEFEGFKLEYVESNVMSYVFKGIDYHVKVAWYDVIAEEKKKVQELETERSFIKYPDGGRKKRR